MLFPLVNLRTHGRLDPSSVVFVAHGDVLTVIADGVAGPGPPAPAVGAAPAPASPGGAASAGPPTPGPAVSPAPGSGSGAAPPPEAPVVHRHRRPRHARRTAARLEQPGQR